MSEPEKVKCPSCNGGGRVKVPGGGACEPAFEICSQCNGTGKIVKE